jgi:hypothetical protein
MSSPPSSQHHCPSALPVTWLQAIINIPSPDVWSDVEVEVEMDVYWPTVLAGFGYCKRFYYSRFSDDQVGE